jgi:hypothetical protein
MVHFKDKLMNYYLAMLTQILIKSIVTLRLWERKSEKRERGGNWGFKTKDYEDTEEMFGFMIQSGK